MVDCMILPYVEINLIHHFLGNDKLVFINPRGEWQTGFLSCHFNDRLFLSQHVELCVSIYLRSYHIKYAKFAFYIVRTINSVTNVNLVSKQATLWHIDRLVVCYCVHDGGNLICAAVKLVCGLHCILTVHGRYERRIAIHFILYDKLI